MFIQIDKSFVENVALFNGGRGVEILEDLAGSHRRGLHLVFAEIEVCNKILQLDSLGNSAKGIYTDIKNTYSETGSLKKIVKVYAIIASIKQEKVHEPAIYINCEVESPKPVTDQCYLLVENSASDGPLYKRITNVVMSERFNVRLNPKLLLLNGGGSTIAAEYKRGADEGSRFGITIYDSDKSSESSARGSTARKMHEAKKNVCQKRHKAIELNAKSAENLIPETILQSLPWQDGCKKSLVEEYTNQQPEEKMYFNLKGKYCDPETGAEKRDGLGKECLEKTIPIIDKTVLEDLSPLQLKEWEEIALNIFSYGCAKQRRFV